MGYLLSVWYVLDRNVLYCLFSLHFYMLIIFLFLSFFISFFFLFLFFIPGLASFLLLNNSKRSIASTKPNCLTMPYVYRFGRCNTAFIAVYFVNFLFLLLLPLVFILLTQLL